MMNFDESGNSQTIDPKQKYNADLEQSVIAGLLIDPESINKADIEPEDFYILRNREIFQIMQQINREHKLIDYITVSQRLSSDLQAYLVGMLALPSSSLYVSDYAAELRVLRYRRDMLEIANRLAKNAYDQSKKIDETVSEIMTMLSTITTIKGGAVHISDVVSEVWDDIEAAAKNPRDIFGFPVKIKKLNDIFGGFQKKEVIKISGEPGVGKSLLAFQFLMDIAEGNNGVAGVPCALFQLEMNRKAQIRRGLSYFSNVKTRPMRTGRIKSDEWDLLTDAVERMGNLPIFIDDNAGHTTTSMRAELARLKTHGVQCVLIDYESLLQDVAPDETTRTARISDAINQIAKDLDVCMFTINDMTKAGISGEAKGNASLAGSKRLIYNADIVMFLRRLESTNDYLLDIGKYREGDTDERSVLLRKGQDKPIFLEGGMEKK